MRRWTILIRKIDGFDAQRALRYVFIALRHVLSIAGSVHAYAVCELDLPNAHPDLVLMFPHVTLQATVCAGRANTHCSPRLGGG